MPPRIRAAALLLAAVAAGCGGSGPRAPAAPVALTVLPCAPGSLRLDWRRTSSNEAGFEVERRTGEAGFARIATVAGEPSFVDRGLLPATGYGYRVRAINSAGASDYAGPAAAATAAEGFVLFSRTNAAGGEDLLFASADGLVAPVQVTDHGEARLDAVDGASRGGGRWVVFAVRSDLWIAPLSCSEPGSGALLLASAHTLGPFAVLDDRWVVAVAGTAGRPRLLSADLETRAVGTLAEFPDGSITWHAPARSDSGRVYFSHRAAPSGGTSFSEVWAAQPETPSGLTPVGGHGLRLDLVELDFAGRPMLSGDAIVLHECLGSSCAVWDLTIGRPGGLATTIASFSAFGLGTHLQGATLAGDRVLYLRYVVVGNRRDLFSAAFAGGSVQLTEGIAGAIGWNGVLAGQRTLFTSEVSGPPLVAELFSVPVDRATAPISIASNSAAQPVAGEFQLGLSIAGDLVVYPRRSTTDALFAAFTDRAGSEQQLAVAGAATVRAALRAAPGGNVERLLLAGRTTAGGESYTDFWSAREQPDGQVELLRLSRQGETRAVPDGGAALALWNDVPKAGRIVFSRGVDLWSVDPARADSEVRLTSFGAPVASALVDPAAPGATVFCAAQGQVWSVPVAGSAAPVQLSDLVPGATVASLHAVAPGGRIVFGVERDGARLLYAADPAQERRAVLVSGAGGVRDEFRFAFR